MLLNLVNFFDGYNKLEEIKGLNNFNASKEETMSKMFKHYNNLDIVDIINFDTSNNGYIFYA